MLDLSLYYYVMSFFVSYYSIYFKVYFVWKKYCYFSFLYVFICLEIIFPSYFWYVCVVACESCFVLWLWPSRGRSRLPVWLAKWPRKLRAGAGPLVGGALSMCDFLHIWGNLWQGLWMMCAWTWQAQGCFWSTSGLAGSPALICWREDSKKALVSAVLSW